MLDTMKLLWYVAAAAIVIAFTDVLTGVSAMVIVGIGVGLGRKIREIRRAEEEAAMEYSSPSS